MEIQFSENTRIISDDRNFIVQKRNKCTADSKMGAKKGEWGAWRDDSYYDEWEYMVDQLLKLKIRQSDAKKLKEVVKVIDDFKNNKEIYAIRNI